MPMHLSGLLGMPRRIFTYPGDIGWDWLNLISTCGAFVIAAGFAVFAWDLLRPKGEDERTPRNPWKAGTLEWSHDVPVDPGWGVRSVPYITSRYPLWDQPGIVERMDAGRYYLADAPEGLRETMVTTVLDAKPVQVLRVGGPTWITHLAAVATGGAFIFPTFHMYPPAIVCAALAGAFVIYWLWTSTARVPDKPEKDVGLGLTLPTYASGPTSVGWWAMWITMLADATAFASLIFGFAYYWTANAAFPPPDAEHANPVWLGLGTALLAGSWAATLAARKINRQGRVGAARAGLAAAAVFAIAGMGAMLAAAWAAGLDPTAHVYPAIVWGILVWTAVHIGAGAVMQLYCLAGSLFGKMTSRYDADLQNVSLYWHFMVLTVLVAAATIGPVPRML
jgi:cytochrome c oxidase subunit 1/cytochrome c oxidase subunit I+III